MIQIHVMTRLHLSTSMEIIRTRVNDDDLNSGISSQLLIKYEMPNPIATPKFAYLYACSLTKNIFLDVLSYQTV